MKEIFRRISESPEYTRKIGEEVAGIITPPAILFLIGELGAGKTEFVRGFLRYYGISHVRSPSFTVMFEHRGKHGIPIYHIDLYRFSGDFMELLERGIIDVIERQEGIVLIEWADKLSSKDIEPDYILTIRVLDTGARELVLTGRLDYNK